MSHALSYFCKNAAGVAVLEGINRLSSLYKELLLRWALFILIWASRPHVFGGQTFLMTDGNQNDARNASPSQQNGQEMFER